jgi:hypothetical protein
VGHTLVAHRCTWVIKEKLGDGLGILEKIKGNSIKGGVGGGIQKLDKNF